MKVQKCACYVFHFKSIVNILNVIVDEKLTKLVSFFEGNKTSAFISKKRHLLETRKSSFVTEGGAPLTPQFLLYLRIWGGLCGVFQTWTWGTPSLWTDPEAGLERAPGCTQTNKLKTLSYRRLSYAGGN